MHAWHQYLICMSSTGLIGASALYSLHVIENNSNEIMDDAVLRVLVNLFMHDRHHVIGSHHSVQDAMGWLHAMPSSTSPSLQLHQSSVLKSCVVLGQKVF